MGAIRSLKPDLTSSQDLTAGALSYESSSGNRSFKVDEVILKASVNITETVTITRTSSAGATYDHIIAKRSMIAEQNFVFRPSGDCNFRAGDEIKVECTNANVTGVVYITIKRTEVLP